VRQTAAAAAGAAASPCLPPSLPFALGPCRPARQVSGSQVSAPTCARGAWLASSPAPAPWPFCAPAAPWVPEPLCARPLPAASPAVGSPPGAGLSPPGRSYSSPQAPTGEVVTSHSFQSLAYSLEPASADHLYYGGRRGSRQASLSPAGDSAVLVLPPPPSPGARSSSSRLSVVSEGESHLLREDSEVFKMLQENREARMAPRQSSSFRLLQEALEAEERGGTPAYLPSSLSPQSSLPTSRALASPPKLHTCEKCNTSIANQAVRIQEGRYRHPGCYTCADCGLNLKMRGHFWVGDELYCEKHARQRYSAPPTLNSQA
uniref:PDZ and LIM domain 2 n=1 Tax=Bos taurus TaxID=9913 RepID=A0AAA9TLV5_BOVIN